MTDDGKKEKGFELRDDDALPQRLQLAQRLTDILATARCPVVGHSLRETLDTNPPLFSIDSSLLLNDIHEGGTKKVETTPNRNSKKHTKPPTQSPGTLLRSIPLFWPEIARGPYMHPPGVSLNRPEPKKKT